MLLLLQSHGTGEGGVMLRLLAFLAQGSIYNCYSMGYKVPTIQ